MFRELEATIPENIEKQFEGVREKQPDALTDILADAREFLGKREDLDGAKDITLAMRSMMEQNLDPYSTYYSKEDIREMESQMSGRFTGIGVQIRRDLVRDGLLVVTPIKGSPAHKAGFLAGDLITEIIREVDEEGKKLNPPEVISTQGMSTKEAVRKILGMDRTKVKIKVVREGTEKPIEFELTRARVDVETVLGFQRKKDDSWDHFIDKKNKIAYIRLTQFAPRSYEDMRETVEKLSKEGIKGLVFDLRFNPGGHLHAAVQISDLFIDDGLIVTIRPRSGVADEEPYGGKTDGSFLNFPMVCMVNGMSASGSEIVAACLQDHGRAVILGERSYGKGSVQNIMDFYHTEAKIKLTWATFWRPNGKNLNKLSTSGKEDEDWGVRPDAGFNLPLSAADRVLLFKQIRDAEIIPRRDLPSKEPPTEFKDKQLEAALEYLRGQIKTAGTAKK
jgi:C-terminal peptidase prc